VSNGNVTALARRYRVRINLGTTLVPDWQILLGVVEFKPATTPKIENDSDYENEGWTGNTKTAQAWELEAKISHKANPTTGEFHPTHVKLRDVSRAFDEDSLVEVQYFDRNGRDDAWQGWALVTWAPEGGDHEQLDRVSVKFTGDGPLAAIENQLNADPDPIIASLAPATGVDDGGTLVIITGAYFDGATAVTFGANPATDFEVISSTKIAAVAPAGTAGTVRVTVTTPDGSSADTAADNYTYTA
jgi:hypothetical protein